MKTQKNIRLLCLFFCVVVCIGAVHPAVLAADEGLQNFVPVNTYYDGQFVDVSSSDWFADEVKVAYELGLVKGDSVNSFNPNGNMRICEAITLACRLHSIYYSNNETFEQGTPWYQVYVDYAIYYGMIARDRFVDYNANATRAEFAELLSAAFPKEALPAINEVSSIPDVFGHEEYADAVYMLYNAGILTGNDSLGTFAPQTTIRRSEVAAIVSRMALVTMRKEIAAGNRDLSAVVSEFCNSYNRTSDRLFEETLTWTISNTADVELLLSTEHVLDQWDLVQFESLGHQVLEDAVAYISSQYAFPETVSLGLSVEYFEENKDDSGFGSGDSGDSGAYGDGGIGYNGYEVYVTPTGKRYHYSASCAGKNARAISLADAQRSYSPCNTCVK